MATGAGKTLTALYLACKVAEKNRPLSIVVVCPYINLVKQWEREMMRFGIRAVCCYGTQRSWAGELRDGYARLQFGSTSVQGIITTNATFLSPSFRESLDETIGHHLVIADEAHNLGSEKVKEVLPEFIQLRLGLSATPERHYDEQGTQAIFDYFGPVVYEFSLAQAIDAGVLAPYFYHPVLVDLTEEEAEEYIELSNRIAKAVMFAESKADHDEKVMPLLIRRSRLLASATEKLPALQRIVEEMKGRVEKAIVYCGDGRVEDPIDEQQRRQIESATRLLGKEVGLHVRRFTYEEDAEEREGILEQIQKGGLDAVVAIRCLDEGIDLPDVRLGFLLASTSNPRQFIQRRGRLLRRAPGKDHAVIYDFIVQPPDFGGDWSDAAFNTERRLFQRELSRILDFCKTAKNGPTALQALQGLRQKYNLIAQ